MGIAQKNNAQLYKHNGLTPISGSNSFNIEENAAY